MKLWIVSVKEEPNWIFIHVFLISGDTNSGFWPNLLSETSPNSLPRGFSDQTCYFLRLLPCCPSEIKNIKQYRFVECGNQRHMPKVKLKHDSMMEQCIFLLICIWKGTKFHHAEYIQPLVDIIVVFDYIITKPVIYKPPIHPSWRKMSLQPW